MTRSRGRWCWIVSLVGLLLVVGPVRASFAENAFGLRLTLPASERPLATGAEGLVLRSPEISWNAPAGSITQSQVNSGIAVNGDRRSRRRILRGEELRWFLAGAVVLSVLDERLLRPFDPDLHERNNPGDPGPRYVSTLATGLPMLIAISTPYVADGAYGRKTTRLALAAFVDAALLTQGLKVLSGKERPYESGGSIRFHGPASGFSSFPSGHTSASFAVATVLGRRYPRYRVALLALATAIGASRISVGRHFPSDVFVGAGIGVYAGRRALATDGRILGIGWRF